jgi:uncharacterized membrane protein (UPF0182 family)
MPQLKKVALAMGNKLAYADTYEQALAQLIEDVGGKGGGSPAPLTQQEGAASANEGSAPTVNQAPSAQAIETLKQVRDHLQRYRELNSQGKWAEAGKELEEIQKLVQK